MAIIGIVSVTLAEIVSVLLASLAGPIYLEETEIKHNNSLFITLQIINRSNIVVVNIINNETSINLLVFLFAPGYQPGRKHNNQ